MASHEVKSIGGHTYLYETRHAGDPKRKQPRKVQSLYLGPCDAPGRLRAQPKVQLEGVRSAYRVCPLAAFYAQARAARISQAAEEVLGLTPGGGPPPPRHDPQPAHRTTPPRRNPRVDRPDPAVWPRVRRGVLRGEGAASAGADGGPGSEGGGAAGEGPGAGGVDGSDDRCRPEGVDEGTEGRVGGSGGRSGWKGDEGKGEEQRVREGRFLLFRTNLKMEAREIFDLWSQPGAIESVFRTREGGI